MTPRQSRYFWAVYINVLSYIVAKHAANHHRPVHLAGSIGARDCSMSKTKWFRAVVALEAHGLIGCDRKVGGWRNRGATYWPAGYSPRALPSPAGPPSRNGSGTVSGFRSSRPNSEPDRTAGGFRIQSEVPRNPSEVPRNGVVLNTVTSHESGVKVPDFRIHESTALVRSSPTESETAAAVEEEAGLPAGNHQSPSAVGPAHTPAAYNPPQSPSHRPNGSAGRGVPVRSGDGETIVYPDRGSIPLDVQQEIHRVLSR